MAKFLNTTGVSFHLEELIKGTKVNLILISPYLQFSDRIKEHIANLNIQKRDIRIVYRENKLQLDENNWLESQIGVRTSICKTLHAKCYLNENEAIITSMNLYEFSQVNNNEMGIHITKANDPELYNDTLEEVQRLLKISEEIRITVKIVTPDTPAKTERKKEPEAKTLKSSNKTNGYCIRTGYAIPFDVKMPMSKESYKSWSKYSEMEYPEKYCHYSGEKSKGETSFKHPILSKYWKDAKKEYNL